MSEPASTELDLDLEFCLHELAGGGAIPLNADSRHAVVFVERGAVAQGGSQLTAGQGLYCSGPGELRAATPARILIWSLVRAGRRAENTSLQPLLQSRDGLALAPGAWIMRLDTVEFPPGSRAHRHDHSGPGTRYLLQGSLEIVSDHARTMMRPGDAWFEGTRAPVLAIADDDVTSKFVRVMILPEADLGKRTIRYLDPADAAQPHLQSNARLFDQLIVL